MRRILRSLAFMPQSPVEPRCKCNGELENQFAAREIKQQKSAKEHERKRYEVDGNGRRQLVGKPDRQIDDRPVNDGLATLSARVNACERWSVS